MSSETNKTVSRRFFEEVFNRRNVLLVDELIAPDFINHNASIQVRGAEGVKRGVMAQFQVFPDIHTIIEDIIDEGRPLEHPERMGEDRLFPEEEVLLVDPSPHPLSHPRRRNQCDDLHEPLNPPGAGGRMPQKIKRLCASIKAPSIPGQRKKPNQI